MPQPTHYFEWVDDPKSVLSNDGLKKAIEAAKDPAGEEGIGAGAGLEHKSKKAVTDIVKGIPPFPFVRESLEKIGPKADVIVVSATPGEALIGNGRSMISQNTSR